MLIITPRLPLYIFSVCRFISALAYLLCQSYTADQVRLGHMLANLSSPITNPIQRLMPLLAATDLLRGPDPLLSQFFLSKVIAFISLPSLFSTPNFL